MEARLVVAWHPAGTLRVRIPAVVSPVLFGVMTPEHTMAGLIVVRPSVSPSALTALDDRGTTNMMTFDKDQLATIKEALFCYIDRMEELELDGLEIIQAKILQDAIAEQLNIQRHREREEARLTGGDPKWEVTWEHWETLDRIKHVVRAKNATAAKVKSKASLTAGDASSHYFLRAVPTDKAAGFEYK